MALSPLDQDPTFLRIKSLNDKWSNIQLSIDKQKQHRQDSLNDKITSLQSQLTQNLLLQQTSIKNLQDHTKKLETMLLNERQNKIVFQNNKKKELEGLEQEVLERVEIQKKTMENTSEELIRMADRRIVGSLEKIEEWNEGKEGVIEGVLGKARDKLAVLEGRIVEERKRREEETTHVTEMIEGELNILHNSLGVQRKIREETQGKIFKMIEEIHGKLQEELDAERKQREQTNAALMNLLDETCSRMDASFR